MGYYSRLYNKPSILIPFWMNDGRINKTWRHTQVGTRDTIIEISWFWCRLVLVYPFHLNILIISLEKGINRVVPPPMVNHHIQIKCKIKWKRGQDDPCGRVVMWDTRGFEKIYDDNHQALLLRYILEGRLQRENLQQALLLSDEICKKR